MASHTDFYTRRQEVNGVVIEYHKCSSCGVKLIKGTEPYFNLSCSKASINEAERLNNIKNQLK